MLVKTVFNAAGRGFLLALLCAGIRVPAGAAAPHTCVDYSNDPAGCQPSTFATPTGQIPSRRVGKDGRGDPKSSEADARAGAALLAKRLHLYRNITPLQWILTVPSVKDPATSAWTGGDLDAMGDARGASRRDTALQTRRHPGRNCPLQRHEPSALRGRHKPDALSVTTRT